MSSLPQTSETISLATRLSSTPNRRGSFCEPPAQKPRIVDDLVPIILESNDHWWPKDLQRLALVSPAWVGPIRRRLYARPKLHSFHACTLFANTVQANRHLLPLIQGLDLRPTVSDGIPVSDRDMANLGFVLNLNGLVTVTLGGELAIHAERFIHMMANTHTITSLHIDGSDIIRRSGSITSPYTPSLTWDDSIAFRFSRSLRTLRITHIHLSITEPDIPYGMRVRDLILEDATIDTGFIQDLLHESWAHLRHLTVSSTIPQIVDDIVAPLLESCENLESLSCEACGGAVDGELFEEDLPALSTLREIHLYDIDINAQSLALLAQSCRGLRKLSVLGRKLRLPAQEWVQLLQLKALPALRVLEISSGSNQPPSGFLRWPQQTCSELRSACDARSISLSYA